MTRPGRRRAGSAAAEFAVLAPLLVLAVVGGHDVASAVGASLRLERAAQAGAQRLMADPSDLAAAQAAVRAALPGMTELEVPLPVLACLCAAAPIACGTACAGGETRIATVTARQRLHPALLGGMTQGEGNAVARLR
ncbi:TadE/TadG family type IV pilus assembly protein [Falsiroseomonas sp. CW058]|uniref:TadE/TadG family type IV pilus assembly protein n=1 Tax=Falsiroseomonas sp. CW058 TaxID=3388664 RepID=UPI003D3223F7